MMTSEPPVPSSEEPVGARPVLPSGIEAGIVGGAAVAAVFLIRDLLAGAPLQTPSVLGTLMFDGPEAARAVVSAPGAAIAYNAVHFACWVIVGSLGSVLMRRVEASATNWHLPWIAVGLLTVGCLLGSLRATTAGLPPLHLWIGTIAGVVAMSWFLAWRHPQAMKHIRSMGGE
jgi:hypothetical protein